GVGPSRHAARAPGGDRPRVLRRRRPAVARGALARADDPEDVRGDRPVGRAARARALLRPRGADLRVGQADDRTRPEVLRPMKTDLSFLDALAVAGTCHGAYDGSWKKPRGGELQVKTPIDGSRIGTVLQATRADYERVAAAATDAFTRWRAV